MCFNMHLNTINRRGHNAKSTHHAMTCDKYRPCCHSRAAPFSPSAVPVWVGLSLNAVSHRHSHLTAFRILLSLRKPEAGNIVGHGCITFGHTQRPRGYWSLVVTMFLLSSRRSSPPPPPRAETPRPVNTLFSCCETSPSPQSAAIASQLEITSSRRPRAEPPPHT